MTIQYILKVTGNAWSKIANVKNFKKLKYNKTKKIQKTNHS